MKLLRDKKRITKFLILYHCSIHDFNRLSEIAEELEMSEQGVSNYVSEMEGEGLLDTSGQVYHPTAKGNEEMGRILSQMGDFLDQASERVNMISSCTAIADEKIEKGDEVGLFMRDGFLHASEEQTSSMGIAMMDAGEGEPLEVGGLHGITELEVGRVSILPVELEARSGSELSRLKDKIEEIKHDRLAVVGETQYGVSKLAGVEPDIIFAPLEGTVQAVQKGLDVLLLVSEDGVENVLEFFEEKNRDLEGKYRIDFTAVQ